MGQDTKGLNKAQMQKALMKHVSPSKALKEEWRIKAKAMELKAMRESEEADRQMKREEAERIESKEKADREFEILKLKFQAKTRQAELEASERKEKAELEARKAELEASERKGKSELEANEMRIRLQMESDERRARIALEEARLAADAEEKERVRQYDLKMKRMEEHLGDYSDSTDSFRIASAVKFVPKFDDVDMDHYILAFEKAMEIHKFPKDKWTALIHTQLTGKAQKVFAELSSEQCQDYDVLKQALLLAYSRVCQ